MEDNTKEQTGKEGERRERHKWKQDKEFKCKSFIFFRRDICGIDI